MELNIFFLICFIVLFFQRHEVLGGTTFALPEDGKSLNSGLNVKQINVITGLPAMFTGRKYRTETGSLKNKIIVLFFLSLPSTTSRDVLLFRTMSAPAPARNASSETKFPENPIAACYRAASPIVQRPSRSRVEKDPGFFN